MKMFLKVFILAAVLLTVPGMVCAQPEPTREVDIFLKPGVDVGQFKTVGKEPSVSISPTYSWSVEKSDPFLRQRIREILENSLKKQGFVLVDPVEADLKVKVTISQWGRFRNTSDINLMEYLDLEFRAYAVASGDLILRATGKYSRVDPIEDSTVKLGEAYASILDEILASLRAKPVLPSEIVK